MLLLRLPPLAMAGTFIVSLGACQETTSVERDNAAPAHRGMTVSQHKVTQDARKKLKEQPGVVSDSSITTKVKTALFEDPQASGFQIAVNTYRGVVQISGFVDTPAQKLRAEELAWKAQGVRIVYNDLIVRSETNFTADGSQASYPIMQSRKEGGS